MGLKCAKIKDFIPHPSIFTLKSEMIFYSLRHSKSRREGYLIGLIAMNRALKRVNEILMLSLTTSKEKDQSNHTVVKIFLK